MERTVTTTKFRAIWAGTGEFYSGIQNGDEVTVTKTVTRYPYDGAMRESVRFSAQGVGDRAGAHLSTREGEWR